MYGFAMKSNIIELFLDVLLLGDKGPDIEAVWDIVKNVRPNHPDQLQISSPLWHGKAYWVIEMGLPWAYLSTSLSVVLSINLCCRLR